MGNELHSHGRHHQTHQPGDDVDAGFPQPLADKGCQEQQQTGDRGQGHHREAEIEVVQGRVVALGMEDDRADGAGARQKRRGQGNHGHRVALGGVELLLFGLADVAHLGVEHGDRHQQDEDAAANPERAHRDPEKTEDGLAGEQHHHENDAHRKGGDACGGIAGLDPLVGGEVDEDRYRAHRIDHRHQGDEKFEIVVEIADFHECSVKMDVLVKSRENEVCGLQPAAFAMPDFPDSTFDQAVGTGRGWTRPWARRGAGIDFFPCWNYSCPT